MEGIFARATKRTLELVTYNVKGYLSPRWRLVMIDLQCTFEIVHVLRFGNELNKELCSRFILIYLYKSSTITRSIGKVSLEILVAKLATNFQDLVANVKNLVALAPVLGAILRPVMMTIGVGALKNNSKQETVLLVGQ